MCIFTEQTSSLINLLTVNSHISPVSPVAIYFVKKKNSSEVMKKFISMFSSERLISLLIACRFDYHSIQIIDSDYRFRSSNIKLNHFTWVKWFNFKSEDLNL